MRRPRLFCFTLLAAAPFAIALLAACGSKATPEKDATLTFGCYVGECVPAATDASDDAAEPDASDASDAGDAD